MKRLHQLTQEMITFFAGDPKRIQHFFKVHSFARLIGEGEGLPEQELFVLEAAALVHDIGIKPAEEKYGRCDGKLQEQEGPKPAQRILSKLNFSPEETERICYLIAHHHTYTNMDGLDYRILLEADFLVNLYEEHSPKTAVETALQQIFCTKTGTCICRTMFGISDCETNE